MSPSLRAECQALCRYLLSVEADDYVVRSYELGVERLGIESTRFDALLCRLATRTTFLARGADLYGRFLRPGGALRKKTVLLLAILESYGPTARHTDRSPGAVGLLPFALGASLHGLASGAALLLTAPFLLPLQALLRDGKAP